MTGMKRVRRAGVTLVGVVLLFTALFAASYAYAHQAHQRQAQAVLLSSEKAAMAKIATQSHGASCQVSGVQPGQLSGILSIPAINLHAPVEEGTDDPELNVAVGHDPQSVWPGVDGAAVFLAHDVSYFVHLNALKPGDVITYATACNTVKFEVSGQQVVPAGSPVSNTTDPSLVLDTCWPPNALFFTPDRLLVRATEVGAATKGTQLDPGAQFIKTVQATDFRTSAPAALQAQGLTLEQNEAPMGTMNLVGASQAFAQSPGTALARGGRARDLLRRPARDGPGPGGLVVGPGARACPCRPSWRGPASLATTAPLDVEIDSVHGDPSQVTLRTTVTLSGGSAPGTHAMTVVLPVHGRRGDHRELER